MTKSFLASAVLLLCLAIFETAILSNITFLPAVPDLVLACSLYLSFLNGRGMGVACGFSSGLFYDFLSGTPFGFNCLLRTLLGYFSGLIGGTVRHTGIVMPAVICFFGTLSKALLVWFISLFFTGIVHYDLLSARFAFELAANTVLAPLLFRFFHSFSHMIAVNPEESD